LDELRRADLREVQDVLLRRRLAKRTIDGGASAHPGAVNRARSRAARRSGTEPFFGP
jgi:hypothetical protein